MVSLGNLDILSSHERGLSNIYNRQKNPENRWPY